MTDQPALEAIASPHRDCRWVTRFTCPEFTTLCPRTAQPDFAHLIIDYIADQFIVESKSLKLYLHSFRNEQHFHEDCTVTIAHAVSDAITPHWLRIGGYWNPRGGIPIDIFYQIKPPPSDVWIPPQQVAGYHPRHSQ